MNKTRLDSSGTPDHTVQRYHHGELRPALIDCARRILEEEGLEALSLRGVARRAGVSRQAPYHHFVDLNALLAAVAATGFRELAETSLDRMNRVTSMESRFKASGISYVMFATSNPALFQLMFAGMRGNFSNDQELQAARYAAFAVLKNALSDTGRADATDLSALKAWSLVHGLADLLNKRAVRPEDFGLLINEDLVENLLR
ncbi:MAG: TetR family transcriptional regulator [Phenylobacterium zucineum]|nr:MAG: TetR family transcriptional regulator [Phenylobacterium zucineum]